MADAWGGSWGTSWRASWGAGVVPVVLPDISVIDGRKRDREREEFERSKAEDASRRRSAVEKAFAIAEGTWIDPEAIPAPSLSPEAEPDQLPDYGAVIEAMEMMELRARAFAEDERDVEMLLLAA